MTTIQKNIAELQVMRGVGIMFVMLHHVGGNLLPFNHEFTGIFFAYFSASPFMDMFFVLSGFLICGVLLKDLGPSESRYHSLQISSAFWVRRAWRLLPAAWIWLLFAVLLTAFANESGAFGSVREAFGGALAALLQVANFKFVDCWNNTYSCGPTFPYWSLSLEEQFYIFLPLLIIFSGKWMLRIIVVFAATQFFIEPLMPPATFRLQGFLLGVLMAIWSRTPSYGIFEPVFLTRTKWGRRFVLFLLLACMCTLQSGFIPKAVQFQLSAIVGGFLVYLASFDSNYLWQDGWFKRFGVWVGARSYSMYLCHIPMFLLTREIAFRAWGSDGSSTPYYDFYLLAGGLVLVVVASDLTYRLLERPLRKKGQIITNEMIERQNLQRNAKPEAV